MQKKHKLVLDTFSGIYDQLRPYQDDWFWDFGQHQIIPDAVYVISRKEFKAHAIKIRNLIEKNIVKVVLSDPQEGSATLIDQCKMLGVFDLVSENKMALIGGGDMDPSFPCLQYDYFLVKLFKDELGTELVNQINTEAAGHSDEIFLTRNKPYKFLFLNGRMRPHRKFLLEKFQLLGLLDQSIWSRLDSNHGGSGQGRIELWHNGANLMYTVRPVQYLPAEYEFDRYQHRINQTAKTKFVKYELFDNQWGEMYLAYRPYVDTYFSVVTETVFTYPYSFRTEKLWKPIAMAHPFIVASNCGYYKDLHKLGFKTFGNLIDETFDQIENDQDRVERIATVVNDLCQQDLDEFIDQCHNTCKYNQQHYHNMRARVQADFPNRFFQFINERY